MLISTKLGILKDLATLNQQLYKAVDLLKDDLDRLIDACAFLDAVLCVDEVLISQYPEGGSVGAGCVAHSFDGDIHKSISQIKERLDRLLEYYTKYFAQAKDTEPDTGEE
jgi:hypothetical protein